MSLKYWDDTNKLITIYCIAFAMLFLHSHDIIHRDLKPANILMILINDMIYPKVADFGISKIINPLDQNSLTIQDPSGVIGTPAYMAPEILTNETYSKACDIYSFAFIVYEIITGKIPYEGLNFYQICAKISKLEKPQFPEDTPDVFKELIESFWNQEPGERPTFEKIVTDLKENKEFITKNVDEYIYFSYIDYFEKQHHEYDLRRKIPSHYIQKK